MRKLAVAGALVLALLAGGSYFLLNTGAGLRWVIGQTLTFTGAPVKIDAVAGTLLGPLTLTGVRYRDPDTGAAARIGELALDWRAGALFRGVLHVTRLRAADVHYAPGSAGEPSTAPPSIPDLALPLGVRLDRLELEAVSVGEEVSAATVVERASLRGTLDEEALVLDEVRLTAPRYRVDEGRIRVALADEMPVDATVTWRAEPPGMPPTAGRFRLGGTLRGTLEPVLELNAPFAARAGGSVSGLLDTPTWRLTIEVPEAVALNSLVTEWPAATVRGRVHAEGDMNRARVQPDLSLTYPDPDIAAVLTGNAEVSREAVVIERLRLTRQGTEEAIELAGRIALDGNLGWTLDAGIPRPVALDDVVPTWPALSLQGAIRGRGDAERATLEPDLSLGFENIEARLTGDVDVSKAALVIHRARLVRPGAGDALDFSGRLGFTDSLPWSLDARLPRPVALDEIKPELPAVSVQGRVQSEGDRSRANLRPELSLAFGELAATLTGEAEVSSERLLIGQARLDQKDMDGFIELSGELGFAGARPFDLQGEWRSLTGPGAPGWSSREGTFEAEGNADALTASISGTVTPPDESGDAPVSLQARASGLRGEPVVNASAEVPYFAFAGVSVRDLNADVDLHDAGAGASRVQLTASSIDLGERRVTGLNLKADGAIDRHQATLEGRLDDWQVAGAVDGSWKDDQWRGTITRLDAESPQRVYGGPWRLEQPADAFWTPSEAEVGELCLAHESTRMCAKGRLAGPEWDLVASVDRLALRWLAADAPEPMRIDGVVSAQASVGNRGSGVEGEVEARIESASIDWQGEDPVQTTYRDVRFQAILNPQELNMNLDGRVDESGAITGRLTTVDPMAPDGAVQGRMSIDLPSLRVVQAAIPALGLRKGAARFEVSIDGTRKSPRFSGEGRVSDASIGIEALGIELTSVELDLSSTDRHRLNIDARATSDDGSLEARGFIEWPDEGGWRGEVRVTGNEAELVRLPRAVIDGSPDLTVTLDQGGGRVTGSVRLTRATLTPDAGRARITISEDIVVVGEGGSPQPTRNPMAWHVDVTIELGDQVNFKGYGVTGRLSGSLNLNAPPGQPTRANGSIEVHDGEYSLYGRTFDIQRGRIIYTGGPIDNPGIDVQVGRDAGEVEVTLSITGPLLDPSLNLSANQAMSDTDMMSYLLLGRPASEASEAEAGLLLRAAASLLPGKGGSGVPAYVQSTLGLDTLELRTDSAETEGASVELGKYLSPKLYVSYVAGFQQAVDIFRVRYELARHWLIRAESSTRESGGDLLFTW